MLQVEGEKEWHLYTPQMVRFPIPLGGHFPDTDRKHLDSHASYPVGAGVVLQPRSAARQSRRALGRRAAAAWRRALFSARNGGWLGTSQRSHKRQRKGDKLICLIRYLPHPSDLWPQQIHEAKSVGETHSTHLTISTYQHFSIGDLLKVALPIAIEVNTIARAARSEQHSSPELIILTFWFSSFRSPCLRASA